MTATIACITPMTPDQARQIIAELGVSWPNIFDRFETFAEYVVFAEGLGPAACIKLGRAIEVLNKAEYEEIC